MIPSVIDVPASASAEGARQTHPSHTTSTLQDRLAEVMSSALTFDIIRTSKMLTYAVSKD
jgi:hypothetical protein